MSERRAHVVGFVLALLLACGAAIVRVHAALSDPRFDIEHTDGLLKSDPALLVYVCERIAESGGLPPADLRADRNVEWPEGADLATLTAIGQEYVVAWTWLALGKEPSLVLVALWVGALAASALSAGVYLLAWELTRCSRLSLLAALLALLLPAAWRTMGFVMMNEDLAVPLFALHLGLLARAVRLQSAASIALAALALGGALATWHAMGFFAAAEAACALAWFARTRENPLAPPRAWIFAAIVAAFACAVPVLRATAFLGSFACAALAALACAAAWTARRGKRFELAIAATVLVAYLATARVVAAEAFAQHAHVVELALAKLAHLGERPADPAELSFDVRLMWQGPFETLTASHAFALLGVSLAAAVAAPWMLQRGLGSSLERATALFALVSLPIAWMTTRSAFLPALLLPVVAAAAAARMRQGTLRLVLVCGVQAVLFAQWLRAYENPWYRFAGRNAEISNLVREIPRLVPAGAAIATDFVNGPAVLEATRRPIVLQPKWESRASRERVRDVFEHLFERSPDELRARLVGRYRTRYLLVDRFTLLYLSSYVGGSPRAPLVPRPGSAAEVLLSQDEAVLRSIPGFTLLWRSPPTIRQSNGEPTDFFRLFELAP